MKKTLLTIFFLLITTKAFAGIGVCHDGAGTITDLALRGNHVYFSTTPNCEYYSLPPTTQQEYDRIRNLIKTVPKHYIKFTSAPFEMTQGEKDSVDAQIVSDQQDEDRLRADRLDFTMEDVMTALVKVINVRIPSNKITKQELIDQLKADKGL